MQTYITLNDGTKIPQFGLAVISNALNLVALTQNKERCEKKE